MEQSATSERSELNNETRFTSPISRKRRSVLIGLSGGVDSALAAYLLKKQGYNVKAVFLKMFSAKKSKLFPKCNWLSDYKAAQKVAHNLEIPLTKIDFEKVYRSQVLEPMFKAYSKGLTPNPDIACNTIIKFPMLWKLAKKLSCNYIATGHYAQIKKDSKGFHLLAGKDKTKDQSYFLSGITHNDLSHTLFPVGELTKVRVRTLAKKLNIPSFNRASTKGLCFVGNIHFQSFLKNKLKPKPGPVKYNDKTIGAHQGSHFYTIGQKASGTIIINKPKELAQKKFFIYQKKGNTIFIAPERSKELYTLEISTKKPKLINQAKLTNLKARIRHLGKLHSGSIKVDAKRASARNNNKMSATKADIQLRPQKNLHYTFHLNKPIEIPAPGQFLVLYNGQELIGSAEIR